ncbi:MAG: amino acid adenylation domain-containing protein [Geminicoccales bacterium]
MTTALFESQSPDIAPSDQQISSRHEGRCRSSHRRNADADRPRDVTIHGLFEAQVARTPDAVALRFEGLALSYRELDARANQLAWSLQKLGVGPEVCVGLSLERSLEMVIALLGVLKAGGAYVPLDPSYPTKRLSIMWQDLDATVLLTQSHLAKRWPDNDATVLCLDTDWSLIADSPCTSPDTTASPTSLAYVIYTSGSTGKPKGVMNEHRAVCNRLIWGQAEYGLVSSDRVLQKTPYSFDVSVWEFFWPLISGAQLIVARPEGHKDPSYLIDLIRRERVTTIHFVPSMLDIFLSEPDVETCTSLKRLFCSGEALSLSLQKRCFARLSVDLHNLYGPTEAAIEVTAWTCQKATDLSFVPIGRPIAKTQIHVLDENRRPVASGVVGEIFIGGVQVARGYLNRPDLTEERFLGDPFSNNPEDRLYRTGDLGRVLEDGSIEYLGRQDQQVKVRGFRIELGEIEKTLDRHPDLRESVVVVETSKAGSARLLAYFIADPENTPSSDELHTFLERTLPDYMIPSAFMGLSAYPLTTTGKLDRRSLPKPVEPERQIENPDDAPKTETEVMLAEILRQLLKIETFSVHHSFLDQGGDSLLGARLSSLIRQQWQIEFSIADVFQRSTLSNMAELIDNSARKEALDSQDCAGPEAELTPTELQQSIWFREHLNPESSAYNIAEAYWLIGDLNPDALTRGVAQLLRRHKLLSARFPDVEGKPTVAIDTPTHDPLETVDLRSLPETSRKAEALRLADEVACAPFSVTQGNLTRFVLYRLGDQEHLLLMVVHHIVADGWSMGIIKRDLGHLYQAQLDKNLHLEEALSTSFFQWAADDARRHASRENDPNVGYWLERLKGLPDRLQLPTDRPYPEMRSFKGSAVRFRLDQALIERAEGLSRGAGATLFMALLTVFVTLLHRYSAQHDFAVGTPVAKRDHVNSDHVVGPCLNTLALRAEFDNQISFRDLLRQVRATTLNALLHQDLPFERLLEAMCPERALSHTPLVQVLFGLERNGIKPLRTPDLSVAAQPLEPKATKFDLSLLMQQTDDGVDAQLHYSTELFDAATAERMAGHYQRLVRVALDDPDQAVSRLDMLRADERRWLFYDWQGVMANNGYESTVHALFEAQAAHTPDAIAVRFRGAALSYRELDERANQLAWYLQTHGVGPEVCVGLSVEPSLEMIIGLLGVLKAGGAYVPLDASYPSERLLAMWQDFKATVLLTQAHLVEHWSDIAPTTLCLDTDWPTIADAPCTKPDAKASPENLAYIIYTSGSTGTPKGVQVTHKQLSSYIFAIRDRLQLEAGMRFAMIQPVNVDLGYTVLFPSLAFGGTLHIYERAQILDPSTLALAFDQDQIDVLKIVPSHLGQLLGQSGDSRLIPRRRLILGGEASSRDLVDLIRRLKPACRLFNHYGPTETTVGVLVHEIDDRNSADATIPLGCPLNEMKAYVLDANAQPTPIGVPGEIWVSGPQVARGYLGEQQGHDRFVPSPLPDADGGTFYRTGDRGRWRADGTIDFLGRIDQQLKIRGYRVEPADIEHALLAHVAVDACVVAEATIDLKTTYLVAYCVGKSTLSRGALRQHVEERLPAFMVPQAFVFLEQLPLLANGKVDHGKLKALAHLADVHAPKPTLPEDGLQKAIHVIWKEVLPAGDVGIHDDFFQCGGHSLLAIQLCHRLGEALGCHLPVSDIFRWPTVAALSEGISARGLTLETATPKSAPSERLLIDNSRDERPDEFPLTDLQHAYWIGRSQSFPLGNVARRYYAYHAPGLNVPALERALNTLVRRHPMLRAIVLESGHQRILEEVPTYRIPIDDLSADTPSQREARMEACQQAMIEAAWRTERWPMFDVRVAKLGHDIFRLQLCVDLLIFDATTWQVLQRELDLLYGEPGRSLPAIEFTYQDFVESIVERRKTERYEIDQTYWQERAKTLPPAPQLPLKLQPDQLSTYGFTELRKRLSGDDWASLKARAKELSLTPTVVMATAYSAILGIWSNSTKFTINCMFSDRPPIHPQINDIVGCFSSTILLEVDSGIECTFSERCHALKMRMVTDLDHRSVSGVEVLAEVNRLNGGGQNASMPVVFASGLNGFDECGSINRTYKHLKLKEIESILQTSQVYLDHQIYEDADGSLIINWDVVEALFPDQMLQEMFSAYLLLLKGLVQDDDVWAKDWGALTRMVAPTSPKHLLAAEPKIPTPSSLLHDAVIQQAKAGPDAIAVVAGETKLTYDALVRSSCGLAAALIDHGTGPCDRVGISMKKGWEQAVACLGTLIAGGVYVPIDPDLPVQRKRYMLDQSGIGTVLTQSSVERDSKWPDGVSTLSIDALEPVDCNPDQADRRATPGDLAYIIYTSGSTGQPKGVAIPHEGALNTVMDCNRRFGVNQDDVTIAISSLSFDLSVYDVFGTLSAGGTLVFPDPQSAVEPAHWLDLMVKHGVTVWNSAPALMQMLIDYVDRSSLSLPKTLRLVMLSGDWIPTWLPEKVKRHLPECTVISLGGATEASIWSIYYPIETVDPTWTSIPYGWPLENQDVYVLNKALEHCPPWVTGDLYIAGIGLAREYWADPEKTEKSFFTHPKTGERLYQTGDLGRYWPDGTIEFAGRIDSQVKIQGFRVECAEVETALLNHPHVEAAIVSAVGERHEAKRLVAHYIPNSEQLTSDELRAHLERDLPVYMIPSAFVCLSSFPVTANGKLDRKALPKPGERHDTVDYVAPRNENERTLQTIWSKILQKERLSVHDDFFELGGNSLMAVQLMSELDRATSVRLPLSALFQGRTIVKLATAIETSIHNDQWAPLVPMLTTGMKAPVVLIPGIGGNVVGLADLADQLGQERPVYGLQAVGLDGETEPLATVEDMATLYLRETRELNAEHPLHLIGHSFGGWVGYELARQLLRKGHDVASLTLLDTMAPIADPERSRPQSEGVCSLRRAIDVLAHAYDVPVSIPWASLEDIDANERFRRIKKALEDAGILAAGTSDSQAKGYLNVLQITEGIDYQPSGVLSGSALLLYASGSDAEKAASDVAWSHLFADRPDVQQAPGTHHSMLTGSNATVVGRVILNHIDSAEAQQRAS